MHHSARTLCGLDWLNFFLADLQTGVGPFLAIYLASYHWNEQQIGIMLTIGGIAGILTQIPAGWLVDHVQSKRALIAGGVLSLAAGTLLIALFPSFWPIMTAQVLIGGTTSVFFPAICAISLGVVGYELFDHRQGRNQTFNSAGNVTAAVVMGMIGYWISNRGSFFFIFCGAIPTVLVLLLIHPNKIDHEMARGSLGGALRSENGGMNEGRRASLGDLLRDRSLAIFLVCALLFHFANAAMLPLLGEMLVKGQGRRSMLLMSACVVTTQLIIGIIASWSGQRARSWGRRPLLLIAFAVLPIRGLLYTLTDNTALLVAIQILDGLAGGIFAVVSVLVISDLTRGTGRFNLTLGVITTAVGIGAALSQSIAGGIVHHFGFHAGFLFLAVVAMVAFAVLYFFMPETRDARETREILEKNQLLAQS